MKNSACFYCCCVSNRRVCLDVLFISCIYVRIVIYINVMYIEWYKYNHMSLLLFMRPFFSSLCVGGHMLVRLPPRSASIQAQTALEHCGILEAVEIFFIFKSFISWNGKAGVPPLQVTVQCSITFFPKMASFAKVWHKVPAPSSLMSLRFELLCHQCFLVGE